jgi:serine/threonine-protein kinase
MQSTTFSTKVSNITRPSFLLFCIVFILSLIGFILAFFGLYWLLQHNLARDLALIVAAGIPAFFFGLSLFPLLRTFDRLFNKRDANTAIFSQEEIDAISSNGLRSHNLSGQKIGAYELETVIGRGGMAEVYRAIGNDVMVAIKLMYPHYRYDEEFVERFYREGEFGLGMNNPHIAAVYEIGMHEGMPYIVMEYVDGEDLGEIIDRRGSYSFDDVALWMEDICKALDIAHTEGFVHRDIKPGNIMVRPNGEAVLMDFGLAKFHKASTRITEVSIGTLGYMAPEQILASQAIDYLADIYSLSIVCYELLTGSLPFDGNSAQIMYAHMNYERPDPRTINSAIPKYMANAIMKAMSIEPSKRFQSAGEFATALKAIPENSV